MNPSPLDLLVLISQPPLSGTAAKEGLDAALVSATFEQKTALAFIGPGVFQLLQQQKPEQLQLKGLQAMLKALPFYDLDEVYTDAQALQDYQLETTELLVAHQPLKAEQLQALIARSKTTLVF